jgi:hypothetical protein
MAVTMTKSEAEQVAREYLKARESSAGCELALIDRETIERNFGWVFFYDVKRHIETGDFRHALAGNGPIVVTKADGRVHETGTAYPLEHYLKEYGG